MQAVYTFASFLEKLVTLDFQSANKPDWKFGLQIFTASQARNNFPNPRFAVSLEY
jgi:hypothetical protein